ncbi:MAG: GWxTD domain-containing protein [Candidatus Zhuqueibacterota bacterium]
MNDKTMLVCVLFVLVLSGLAPGQEAARVDSVASSRPDSIALLIGQIDAGGHPLLRVKLAQLYLQDEKYEEAEVQYEYVTGIDSLKILGLTGIGLTHYHRGPSKVIPLERLKELFKKDHYSKAIGKFEAALEIDPAYLPARYFLALTYQKKGKSDNLQKARDILMDIHRDAPDYRDAFYQLGYTHLLLKDYGPALKSLQQIQPDHKDYARASIRKANVYYEIGNPKKATESYFTGIETLDDPAMLDELYDELRILLSPSEKKEFEAVALEESRALFKKFWRRRDPDPSTPENERLMEHFRRVNFAHENFHFTAPPYYDDRGRIYIKYGPPDDRYHSQLGSLPAKDNESWTYESVEKGLVFDFVSEGGYFRQVDDLTEAAIAGYSYESRLVLAGNLYANRSHLSQAYANLSVSFSWDRLNNFHGDRGEALEKYPGELYRYEFKSEQFPFLTKWAQFRGDSGKTRFEVFTSFPGVGMNFEKEGERYVNYTDFFIDVQDSNYNSIISNHDRFSIKLDALDKMETRQFLFQQNYQILPGQYDFSFVINNKNLTRKGVKKEQISVRDFTASHLMLSDIQLSSDIQAGTSASNKMFVKNDLSVTPYTFSRVIKSKPIHVYFEIYNLTLDSGGNSNFEVSYTVKTIEPRRSFWQKTLGSIPRIFSGQEKSVVTSASYRSGNSTEAIEYIAFDLTNLENGVTELLIKITDNLANQSVQEQRQFTLFE